MLIKEKEFLAIKLYVEGVRPKEISAKTGISYKSLNYTIIKGVNEIYRKLGKPPITRLKEIDFNVLQNTIQSGSAFTPISIGEQIRKFRIAKNFSRSELSRKISLNSKILTLIEYDQIEPSIGIIIDICRTLDVSFEDFFYNLELSKNVFNAVLTEEDVSLIYKSGGKYRHDVKELKLDN